MDSYDFIEMAERDALLVDAFHRTLYAMSLTNGCAIHQDGIGGILNFEYEMALMRRALFLLGIDTTQPLPAPRQRT